MILRSDCAEISGTPSVGIQSMYRWYLSRTSVFLLSSKASTTRRAKFTGSSAQNIKRILGTQNWTAFLLTFGDALLDNAAPRGMCRTWTVNKSCSKSVVANGLGRKLGRNSFHFIFITYRWFVSSIFILLKTNLGSIWTSLLRRVKIELLQI